MSYPCPDGYDEQSSLYFSNPDVTYKGKATGTKANNNARTIRDNMVKPVTITRCMYYSLLL